MRIELKTGAGGERPRVTRRRFSRSSALAFAVVGASGLVASTSHAQSGTTQRPMPDVLLLVDTSGSMERMPDNSLPEANNGVPVGGLPNACSPGVESSPNRWGMLVQAMTGNMLPYFSCAQVDRSQATGVAFRSEYSIAGVKPYDVDYTLPYHRPLTGSGTTTCAIGPNKLPGASSGSTGVGPSRLGYGTPAGQGGDVTDFPDDAIQSAGWAYMQAQYAGGLALADPLGTNACIFNQTPDGQLDAARDYVRFALMTFDNDPDAGIGVNAGNWPPSNSVMTPIAGTTIPFLGQWSYRRDPTNPGFPATLIPGASEGRPAGCAPPNQPYEVGSRHWGAPPWEGRMVQFPAPDASILDIERTNDQIQKVLLTARPFGPTPIDGMMDDASDYYRYNGLGPSHDPYIANANCRDQYIILLTDGAPNLDMRPSCEGAGGLCPYPSKASATAATLWNLPTNHVTTYVIGFSVNGSSSTGGDGFPAPYNVVPNNNCKAWYAGVSAPSAPNPAAMAAACTAAHPPTGSTAEACCVLNEIAYQGSGGTAGTPAVGPFFAESQADIVLSFGKILATVTKSVSTRTVPAFTPAVYAATSFGTAAVTAEYLGSFIPNADKPWSGEIARDRSICGTSTGTLTAEPVTPSIAAGDSEAMNLAIQGASNRLFWTFVPDKYSVSPAIGTPPSSSVIDAGGTVRPFYPNTEDPQPLADGIPIPASPGTERSGVDWTLKDTADFRLALDIDQTTCKRGRAVGSAAVGGTIQIPALNQDSGDACTRVVMGFATAHSGSITETGTIAGGATGSYDFNIRCSGSATAATGFCSISQAACNVSDADPCPGVEGQVCVPACSALGAIFRANLAVSGPPDGLLRDSGYRAFQGRRQKRRPILYAATTDGILHAFKAVEQALNAEHELWSFIPPAVLPRLASNYPSGNQILLDGSPVTKDTVWDRSPGDLDSGSGLTPGAKWHTTLVAGLGVAGGGYYAVNVTDPDCNADPTVTTGECRSVGTNPGLGTSGFTAATDLDTAGRAAYSPDGNAKPGPHFLWQLTDVPKDTADTTPVVRRTLEGQDRVSLFGTQTGTPAITTVQLHFDSGDRQVGVAILPGGITGSPVPNAYCNRFTHAVADVVTDAAYPARAQVRQWGTTCASPVPGRGLTIVRLDNGQILRHFGQQLDIPDTIYTSGVVNDTKFDSPVIGTPVVYPQTVGAVAQKIFVGDADGTLWRLDVTSTDPAQWNVKLFADLVAVSGATGASSEPVAIAPVLSLEPGGSIVVNASTGDQENVIYKAGETNYVWSIQELRPVGTTPATASVKWYESLPNGERVTGPMTVFDRTLYFASFAPRNPATGGTGSCDNAGAAKLWGLNYFVADSSVASGGQPMWCATVAANGVCSSGTLTKNETVTGALAGFVIPGVSLRPTQACSLIDSNTGEGTGNTGFETLSPASFQLTYGVGKAKAPSVGFPPAAQTSSRARPLPRITTTVNAWALVVD